MAKQIEGVYERVLECAKVEFLEKGYKDASLRIIAQNADTSTGSIYTRFGDKNGLFNALAAPVVEELKQWFDNTKDSFDKRADKEKADHFDYSKDKIIVFLNYIYDHYDVFKLLIISAEGTAFSSFVHEIVEIDVDYTIKFIEAANNTSRVSPELIHMLSSAFYTGIFETVVHDMDKETALVYVRQMQKFYQAGWREILGGEHG